MFNLFKMFESIPSLNTPKRIYESIKSAKLCFVVLLAMVLLVLLNGKRMCFSVLAAELQNQTCNSVKDTCGMATLNWIAFLHEMIVIGGNPFIMNMLMRVHGYQSNNFDDENANKGVNSGVLGSRIMYQFVLVLIIGVLLTNFVVDPESLFVTDTIIQGCAIAMLVTIVTFKLNQMYPESNEHHRTILLLTEVAPWFSVIICPMYAALIARYNWQSTYLFICLLILIVCIIAGICDPRRKRNTTSHDEHSDDEMDNDGTADIGEGDESQTKKEDDTNKENEKHKEMEIKVRQTDYWEMEDVDEIEEMERQITNAECHNPSLLQLLLNTNNMSVIITRPIVIAWFVERALAIVAQHNLVINIVHYMSSVLLEPLIHASTIMLTLGCGYIMGFLIVYVLPPQKLRHYLPKIYALSTVLLVISYIVWQIYGGGSEAAILSMFTVPDAHFMVIVIGVFSATSLSQMHIVAEYIIERPKIVSVSLTKLAQGIGLLFGPITSGMLIQINVFKSFFAVQAVLHGIRLLLLGFIIYKKYWLNKMNG